MKNFTTLSSFAIFVFSLLFIGCGKKSSQLPIQNAVTVEMTKKNYAWYYFSNTSYHLTDRPQNSPIQVPKPWTESLRISSANNESCTQYSESKAFAIVNRLGILTFKDEAITLSPDTNIFTDRTAGNLVFLNNIPVFSVYKSAFFNDTILNPDYKNDSSAHLFLLQFDINTKISYPLINCNNLTEKINSEITDFYWNGIDWCCSIKTISNTKNEFSYIKFKPLIPLLSLSPSTADNKISIQECSADDFRHAKIQYNYSEAPERIRNLFSGFETKIPFIIEVKIAGGNSPRIFENNLP